ncbi:peptide/nickel transport system permease protein [Ketogulonicigenium robustum]|uniref:Peptide/nickel transport system permease protein n=1 Tax=Ketogulonicigenium robustum TaxID=92947 RepID=A0A1W6NXR4_9RHOB|nr:ABC transporter permease [Ketogulonicigenium robustum]ARO13807.1 peptide/nickel transport system permease protein [Ketogulonicigenium robustum]
MTGRTLMFALVPLLAVVAMALAAPWLAPHDPMAIAPAIRLQPPSATYWLGTDAFGRDIASRMIYGSRVSLIVGAGATIASVVLGMAVALLAGCARVIDATLMRVMDGIMAIPGVLLAIALAALSGATLGAVLAAIIIPEVPRVARLVRGGVLQASTEPYVEAAVTLGTPMPRILLRHILPSTFGPLIVQATFIFGASILTEATLGFLGAGLPSETPSWGNIMAQGRMYFQLHPGMVLFPGLALAVTLLCVNCLGNALHARLDPVIRQA